MDTDDDMPNFLSGANTRRVDFSDSEDDTLLSSTLDHDGFEGLNVSDKIKNIMSIDNFYMDNTFDDQNDALFEMPESLKNREMPSTSEPTENRFMNFPFNKPESSPPPAAPQKKKRASASKKPKEKKRKRDRGKKDKEIPQDVMERPVNHERTTAFLKELAGAMDFSSDDEESGRLYKPKPKKTRKTRKPKSLQQMDENGEQMMRTTDILGDTSSSEDDDKRMTKRDELEMYRETDRLRREADISIKPTFHKKSFNDFVSRLANRKSQIEHKPTPPIKQPISKQDEFEDDLEIVGGPTSLLSPSKPSAIPWSPVATSNNVHKKHNQQLRDRIAQHMYTRRKEMEEAAISRGEYTSATDRAKKTLQREKENELIFMEVNKHFNKSKNNDDDEEEEEDGDYNDEEGYDDDDDIMGEYSGQEEDDDEEDEEEEEDNDDQEEKDGESTPKDNNNNDDDENEEDDLATVAFKRWKRKPGKKSIFDDDDDEVEKPKVEAKKPEPKHSIAKFFKNNTKTITTVKNNVTDGNKPLSRLKQRDESIEEEEDEEQGETEQAREDESMDIDEEPTKQHVTFAPIAAKPQGPKPSSRYLEEEAEEEEDEHFGAGGPDVDDTEDLDQFEDDGLLVERNEETDNVDESVLKGKYSEQMMEKDKNMIDRLMKDITGGGLRRRKAAAEDGLMLDDFDIYDNDEDDLIAIRRAAAAKRRRMLLENGDVMEHLASNPKTAAFAKAAQTVLDEENRVYLSDSEEEVEETQYKSNTALVIEESDEEVEEEDEDDENEASASAAPIVVKENRMEYIEEDESSYIESTIQVQTMTRSHASPLSSHHKPFFRSPGKMDRFKSLLGEGRISFGGSNDTGGARVGFGAPVPKKDKGKEPVRGFVPTKTDKKATKSRLLGVMSSRADSFT